MTEPVAQVAEMLLDFEPDLRPSTVRITTQVPRVVERVSVNQQLPQAYLARPEQDWCWEDLRDYVVAQYVARFGVFPRDARKEYGIFTSFVGRWGIERAVAVARYAFEVMDGRWRGSPVSVTRFCKNSDPYFADPILDYLAQHT